MDMQFGAWDIQSLYMTNLLVNSSKEVSNSGSDLAGVQEVRREGDGSDPAEEHIMLQKGD
jgi:hypothetical protein